MNNEITPLYEKINQYERYGDVKEVDQIRIWNDVKEALKNFCDELKDDINDFYGLTVEQCEIIYSIIEEAKLKHFGKELM